MSGAISDVALAWPRQPPAAADRLLSEAEEGWASAFGTGSRRELRDHYARELLEQPQLDDASCLRVSVECEHRAKYGANSLAAELEDERARDAAVSSDAALIAYEGKWAKRLLKLQRAYPSRWRLPELSDAELRDELTLRLIDALRSQPDQLLRHHRAGKEWGLCFLTLQRRALRKGFRLEVVLVDPSPVLDRAPTEEERLIEEQHAGTLRLARERAEHGLTRPQRRWLAAMKMSANAGAFFEASGKLNLSAASRLLEKNRSSAQRAFAELQHQFARELRKLTASR